MKQHTIGARVLAALLPLACMAGFSSPASADLPAVLQRAALTSGKLGSYHVTMTSAVGGMSMTASGDVQSVSPAKMHMTTQTPQGSIEMVIIAPNAYMKQGGAAWQKLPGDPGNFAQMNVASMLAKDKDDYVVTDIGTAVKDGQMLHGYRALNKVKNTTSTVWLDSAGRFARVETAHAVMKFSNYGESLNIKAPI